MQLILQKHVGYSKLNIKKTLVLILLFVTMSPIYAQIKTGIIAPKTIEKYDCKELIRTDPSLVTIDAENFDKYVIKEFVREGAKVILGGRLDKYDIIEIIKTDPSLVTIDAENFDKYDIKEFVREGAHVLVGGRLDKYDIIEIIRTNSDLVTVDGSNFDKYDLKELIKTF